ncbi:hypothetical protein GLOIN_2v1662242 [Rhizophagus irregularis DAOM 181602=DAOM 197198]|uniref:Uncharacterized protein n=1 Tax=Rhizophagus irregularis (strain DAOM 181602 / DAOM 197198 / MUCL 43194) TaxID=747089 RepID=A0A2P4PKP3_RHIID|nr:hypothetical protein GLOIN_2v1662242 [Rhizophagus irregularis DAOM 181602=DAOM 197198]POG65938.1 hypothetical protein GLOIN_2v1662242 [Rhizophagus irregularis DAOM 181602=DAOM 197198]|eukprot:XP_025172804.1 hypothetical protein GLOIN_2v1662242 [Rhizophagus irregularis DAOM 181602=DAOM 197198]
MPYFGDWINGNKLIPQPQGIFPTVKKLFHLYYIIISTSILATQPLFPRYGLAFNNHKYLGNSSK